MTTWHVKISRCERNEGRKGENAQQAEFPNDMILGIRSNFHFGSVHWALAIPFQLYISLT